MIRSVLRATLCVSAGALVVGCASSGASHEPRPPRAVADSVSANDIERNGGDIERVLQANSPGAIITRTADGGIAVQVRGPASFYGGEQPLYVLDGIPFQPGPGGALAGINPHDIESIKVLKNPQDTGIYGVRGANGVVVITMKKAGRRPSPP